MTTSGIGAIKNIQNEKIFAFKSFNLEKQYEIYLNQLKLNIHHNLKLQKDWNALGSEYFEFLIIEEIYDEFDLEDGFVDYVSLLDNSYNQFSISSFFFEYSGNSGLMVLYDLIGKDKCSTAFLNILEKNDLSEKDYDEIKEEMVSLIENGFIDDDYIEDKLDELIQDKSYQIRVVNLDMQYELMNELEDIVGISELNEEFTSKLLEKGLSKSAGFLIKDEIMELIFSNNVENNDINKQIDSSIEIIKERISKETIEKLLEKSNNLENDAEFINKLQESGLPLSVGSKITNDLNDLILSGLVNENNYLEKLDELINIEAENRWLETKKELHAYLARTINSYEIKTQLKSNNLNPNILPKINDSIKQSIENKEIVSENEIDDEIIRYIKQEVDNLIKLKDGLLLYLNNEYGRDVLTSSFETRLNNVQLDISSGKRFILEVASEINSFEISSVDEVDKRFETLFFDENKNILIKQFYDLVGKEENTSSFSSKLKLNYLTDEDGARIRKELFNLIYTETNLEKIVEYRNTLELKLDEIIEIEGKKNYNKMIDLSKELTNYLNDIIGENQINELFKNKLYSNNLGEEFWELVKVEVTQMIENDADGPNFESKMNQLNALNKKGIDVVVHEIVMRESATRREEYSLLKEELMDQLNELIGAKENTPYYDKILFENNLNSEASDKIRNTLNSIIALDSVYNPKQYNYKYEELLSVKNKTINRLLLELVEEQKKYYENALKDLRLLLIGKVEDYIGGDSVEKSFEYKLYSNQLSLDYAKTFKEYMVELINSDELYDKQFKFKLDELTNLNNAGVDSKIDELIEKESQIKIKELNDLKKELSSDLDKIVHDNKFKEDIKANNLSSKAVRDIENEIYTLINSDSVVDSKFNYKLEELTYLNKKSVSSFISELVNNYTLIYERNLSDVRKKLHYYVESIIGIATLNVELKEKLHKNDIPESFVRDIKNQMNTFIDTDEVCDKKYEVKLDELNSYSCKDIELKIDGIIESQRTIIQSKIEDVRQELNNDLINLIGKKNNEYYDSLLKSNNLNSKTGAEIREDLWNLINSESIIDNSFEFRLDELTALKEQGIQTKLNELIKSNAVTYKNSMIIIRRKLIKSLEIAINSDSLKKQLHENNLQSEYKKQFKKEIMVFINSDNVYDDKFEVKYDELFSLQEKTIKVFLGELIQREANIKREELICLRNKLIDNLNTLIGENENNEYYNSLLKSNSLNSQTGDKIRFEIVELINSRNPVDSVYEFKLDELIALDKKGLKQQLNEVIEREKIEYDSNLKNIREKLLKSLNEILHRVSFKETLFSKQIDDSFVDIINEKLTDLINSKKPCDDKFEVKLDELESIDNNGIDKNIDQLVEAEARIKLNEFNDLQSELEDKLFALIGKDKNSMTFNYKLVNNNLNNATKDKIRDELIDLVTSDECIDSKYPFKLSELKDLKEYGLENKIDDLIEREVEKYNISLNETRKDLIDLVNLTIGKNMINFSFKQTLIDNDLEEDFAYELKQQLFDFINSDEVSKHEFKVKLDELKDVEKKGINTKIKEFMDKELDRRSLILKEKQLKELFVVTGDIPLSEEYLEKLNNANFDEKMGLKIVNHFKSEIDSLNIPKGFDFEQGIDDRILDESKNILFEEVYDIIGKESNSDYFNDQLKENMITPEIGDDIRSELISMIEGADLKTSLELRKSKIKSKFDRKISEIHTSRLNKLEELRNDLIKYLNKKVNSASFNNKLSYQNLSPDYAVKIQNEIKKFINSNEVEGDFEFKVDELDNLSYGEIDLKIDEIIERESKKINSELVVLKKSLFASLDKYIGSSDNLSTFAKEEISKRKLTIKTGIKAYNDLYDLIESSQIKDFKFKSKYDELKDLQNITVKNKYKEKLDTYSKNQEKLITFLYSITIEDNDFKRQISSSNFTEKFVNRYISNTEVKIRENKFTTKSQITNNINTLLRSESNDQKKALEKLHRRVGKNRINLVFRATLILKGLTTDDGKTLLKNVTNKIRNEGLKEDQVDREIERQLNLLSSSPKQSKSSKPPKNPKPPKIIFCSQCGYKNDYNSNFCMNCGKRLLK